MTAVPLSFASGHELWDFEFLPILLWLLVVIFSWTPLGGKWAGRFSMRSLWIDIEAKRSGFKMWVNSVILEAYEAKESIPEAMADAGSSEAHA